MKENDEQEDEEEEMAVRPRKLRRLTKKAAVDDRYVLAGAH